MTSTPTVGIWSADALSQSPTRLAAGLLVAGSRTGLLADLSPGAVVGVPPGDHEALARELLRLLADPDAMERRRESLHLWARVHTMEWTVQQYAALYRELAAGR